MRSISRRARRVAKTLALVPLLLQGCSLFGDERESLPEDGLGHIAQDLVFTLVQLPSTNPLSTTVQMSDPVTPFGDEVVSLVREAGYGIQSVPDDRGGNHLRYREERIASELGVETRYAVSIGDVEVERAYGTADGDLVPLSAQQVSGTGAGDVEVELDTALFGDAIDPAADAVRFEDRSAPLFTDAAGEPVALAFARPAPDSDGFAARVKENLYHRLSSNYAELFASYADVDSVTIDFGNDSMRLGKSQKLLIDGFADRLRPDTDLLSVIGCSHGATALTNGNSLLALGRANRVKEALVFAGVPPGAVLDEGCWAGQGHPVFPARGVVLTLKRRLG